MLVNGIHHLKKMYVLTFKESFCNKQYRSRHQKPHNKCMQPVRGHMTEKDIGGKISTQGFLNLLNKLTCEHKSINCVLSLATAQMNEPSKQIA